MRPAQAELTVRASRGRADVVRRGGEFEVRLQDLPRGETEVRLEARLAGSRPWRERVTAVRR